MECKHYFASTCLVKTNSFLHRLKDMSIVSVLLNVSSWTKSDIQVVQNTGNVEKSWIISRNFSFLILENKELQKELESWTRHTRVKFFFSQGYTIYTDPRWRRCTDYWTTSSKLWSLPSNPCGMLQQQEVMEWYFGFEGYPRHNLQSYIHRPEKIYKINFSHLTISVKQFPVCTHFKTVTQVFK